MSSTSYTFTTDWFTYNIPTWQALLRDYVDRPNVRALEIGSYQGRSATWLLDNVLTHPSSSITCVDTFKGSVEHSASEKQNILEVFMQNMSKFPENKVITKIGPSSRVLRTIDPETHQYDLIYIDGDHRSPAVLEDAVLAFPLLKPGGIMIFDDYEWGAHDLTTPKMAIDTFLLIYMDLVEEVHRGYQVAVRKLGSLAT